LRGLLVKTAGLSDLLQSALKPLSDRIRWAFIYGSIAHGRELATSDVDLMVIGDVGLAELAPKLHKVERRLDREVNPTHYCPDEFARKIRKGNHFLLSVIEQPKLFLIGDPDAFARFTG
jgi:predicted nucleotidyltransferase